MNSAPNSAGLGAWRTFLEAHSRVTTRLERELQAEHELPLAWYDVLVQLNEAPAHRLRMTELADAVLLSKSGLTRLIDRMLADGLVDRSLDRDDLRGVFVSLSEAGLERLREAAPTHMRGIQEHFAAHLSEAETRTLAAALGRIAHA